MIQKKRLQICGLACLLGAFTFSPAMDAFAGWKNTNGTYYHYDDSTGNMTIGWFQEPSNSKWYYLKSDGSMTVGWIQIDGNWYYFDPDGKMATGWRLLDGRAITTWISRDE